MRVLVRRVVVLAVMLALVGSARAHEVAATRFTAPVPLLVLFAGAGATVAATAGWLGFADGSGVRTAPRRLRTVGPAMASTLRLGVRTAFVALVVGALVHGVVGPSAGAENLATVFVWSVWLKGLGLVAVLVGSPWRVLSPWETVYDLLVTVEGEDIALVGDYPSWLGSWPALAGFVLGVGVVENLTVIPRTPRLTVAVVAAYALAMVGGGVAFGRPWFRHADALAVLYDLLGRTAPLSVEYSGDGSVTVEARPPWRGCTDAVVDAGAVAFVVAAVYTVSFDGYTDTPEYQAVLAAARDLAGTTAVAAVALYLLGLVAFLASYGLACWLVARLAGDGDWPGVARAFAPTVVPIAAAYEVAHNYPFVARSAAQLLALFGRLVTGTPVEAVAPLSWLSVPAFWGSQVALVVGGHLVAVVAAHLVAIDRYGSLTVARRGHLPLVVVMVGYTVLSLWIVSRPVVA
ncbi:hypothetical protein QA599_16285 [Haloarculaceae archaeon H-GB1-1]|nr:hypothetical protein [Haloarculaceae archaeon H-GB1-1]